MEAIEWKRIDDETFNFKLNGVDLGNWNKSKMRHLIEVTDNAIENYTPNG